MWERGTEFTLPVIIRGSFLSKNRFVIHTDFITHSSFFFTKAYYISLLFSVVTIQIEVLVQS
jgi:hypothetical protein